MAVSLGRASTRLPAYCLLSTRFRIAEFSDAIKAVAVSVAQIGDQVVGIRAECGMPDAKRIAARSELDTSKAKPRRARTLPVL